MKSIATSIALASVLAFATAAWAGQSYRNADLSGTYSCGISGTMKINGNPDKTVGTGYIDPAGNGQITASTITLNVEDVGECHYELDSTQPTKYTLNADGTGAAGGTYNVVQDQSASSCLSGFVGIITFACADGQIPKTCYVNTVDAFGKVLLSGTCTKQFLGRSRPEK
jgi:hypothetical protein